MVSTTFTSFIAMRNGRESKHGNRTGEKHRLDKDSRKAGTKNIALEYEASTEPIIGAASETVYCRTSLARSAPLKCLAEVPTNAAKGQPMANGLVCGGSLPYPLMAAPVFGEMGLAGLATHWDGGSPSVPRPALDHAMPEYLATVRRPDGRKVTENVVASSADEAVRFLRERGYDEVVLHSDDTMALFIRQREKAEHISPGDYLLLRNLPRGVGLFVVVTLNGYRKMWFTMVLTAFGLAYLRSGLRPWAYWDWLCVAILLLPPAFALCVALFGGRIRARHQRMLDALFWGRWEECLWRADRVGLKVPPQEIALRKAQALAGLDRLDEALRLVEPFADGQAVPFWFYRSMLAQVYEFARRRDTAIAQLEQAVELAPDNGTMLLSLARHVIWHKRDPRRARELLTQARTHALSDITTPFADLLEGVILLEEGRPRDALPVLEAAHKVFHARRHMPLGYLAVEQAMLARALTHAALGESEEALKLYGKARPRLVALRSEGLDRCDRAIGLPRDG